MHDPVDLSVIIILFLLLVVFLGVRSALRALGGKRIELRASQLPEHSHTFATKPTNYPVLRFIAGCLRVIGWLSIVLGTLALLATLFIAVISLTQHLFLVSSFSTMIFGSIAAAALTTGLVWVAFGELIRVFVDMSLNTERLLHTVRDPEDKSRLQGPNRG